VYLSRGVDSLSKRFFPASRAIPLLAIPPSPSQIRVTTLINLVRGRASRQEAGG